MAKRLTATEKWDDPWFCEMSTAEKLFWIYLMDKCDHAGIWQVNWRLVKFHIPEFEYRQETFKDRIIELSPSKWFIPKFVGFQYLTLNPENRAHQSVISRLQKEGAYKGLASPKLGCKDMDKVKDKDKDKDKKLGPEEKVQHQEYVWLNAAESKKLAQQMGPLVPTFISRLNGYIGQIGEAKARAKYKSHYHTILNWYRGDIEKGVIRPYAPKPLPPSRTMECPPDPTAAEIKEMHDEKVKTMGSCRIKDCAFCTKEMLK